MTQAAPSIQLSALRVDMAPDGTLHGKARLDDASWQPVGETPAIQGAAGNLLFDRDAIALEFAKPDPEKPSASSCCGRPRLAILCRWRSMAT